MPRIYLNQTVIEAARDRFDRLFREFDVVAVNTSGGKDSTVVLHLALEAAERTGKLPVPVVFLDQEAEWQTVIDFIRVTLHDPRIDMHWLQIPIVLFNAASSKDEWLQCWDPGHPELWLREKEPDSIHVNRIGTNRFADGLSAWSDTTWPDAKVAQIAGVRCEESPGRAKGLTTSATYRDITWGTKHKVADHYTFYPIYDWTYVDVWKYIHDGNIPYCPIYDYQYQHGVPVRQMRVSNVHHETAIRSLDYMQELEPETWNKLLSRLSSVNAVRHVKEGYEAPKELPFMFASWGEYRDHLLENLVDEGAPKEEFRKQFRVGDAIYKEECYPDLHRMQVNAILHGDYHRTKLDTWRAANGNRCLRGAGRMGSRIHASKDV